jgi:hypothetical protein
MVCRWAQVPDNKQGIMPSILEELLKARKDPLKMIKTEPIEKVKLKLSAFFVWVKFIHKL